MNDSIDINDFCAVLGLCVLKLRNGNYFGAGMDYSSAVDIARCFRSAANREKAFQLLNAVFYNAYYKVV